MLKMSWLAVLGVVLCFGVLVQCDRKSDERIAAQYAERFRQGFKAANITAGAALPPGNIPQAVAVKYECELPLNPPSSIHNLSPPYVQVIAALGDSVTAGFGAGSSTIIDTRDYRGLSWCIGGDKTLTDVQTLPNVIRTFNPNVYGYSTGIGNGGAELNVAVSGARTRDMYDQAVTLVSKMQEKGYTDEWKVITMWIGGNDICDIKSDGPSAENLAEEYTANVAKALDYLQQTVKNAFVNVALMINIAELAEVKGITCGIVHQFACNSITKDDTKLIAAEVSRLFNDKLKELVDSGGKYETDDFAVILQPFFSETKVPRLNGEADKSYFAPDCFHFSQKGHGVGAAYLWNNMFENVGQKTTTIDWDNQQPFDCPTDNPVFRTHRNS